MSVKNAGELIDMLSEFDREAKVIISAEFSESFYFEFHGEDLPAGGIFNFGGSAHDAGFVEIFLGSKFKVNDARNEMELEENNHHSQNAHPCEPLGVCQKMENDMHLKLINALGKAVVELKNRVAQLEDAQNIMVTSVNVSLERIESIFAKVKNDNKEV